MLNLAFALGLGLFLIRAVKEIYHQPRGGGGTYLEKDDMDVRRTRPPFSRLSAAPQDPLFSILQFHKTPFLTKNRKIFEFSVKNTKI